MALPCQYFTILMICRIVYFSNAADTDYLWNTIREKFGDNRHHIQNPTYKLAAKEFIFLEFKRYGLETSYQDFIGGYIHDLSGRKFTNVIGVLKGSNFGTAKDKIVGIGAHYDTVRYTSGVDDNGAGVTAMLETAKMLTSKYSKPQNTVIFVAFDIEEYLYEVESIGSQHFVDVWLNQWLQQNYGNSSKDLKPYGVIILDTVMYFDSDVQSQLIPGDLSLFHTAFPITLDNIKADSYRGDFLSVIYRKPTTDKQLAESFKNVWDSKGQKEMEIEMFGLPTPVVKLNDKLYNNFVRSDHYHFWKRDLPAIFITDTANFRGKMKNCYHQQCDNLKGMLTTENIRFLAKIADSLTTTLANLGVTSDADKLSTTLLLPILMVLASHL